jgi:integrase
MARTRKRGNGEGTIFRRQDGRYVAQVTLGRDPKTGKLQRKSLYGHTRQEVAQKMSVLQVEIHRGEVVIPHRMTLGAWLDLWLKEYKALLLRRSTLTLWEEVLHNHIKPGLGHYQLQELRPEHLQQFYNEKLRHGRMDGKGGLSADRIGLFHMIIHMALGQAVKNGLVVRNVSDSVDAPRVKNSHPHPLTVAQVKQLLDSLTDDDPYQALLTLALSTGLRRGEILGLRWQDIDFEQGVLRVRQAMHRIKLHQPNSEGRKGEWQPEDPKSERSKRTVPLTPDVQSLLRQHRAQQAQGKLLFGQLYKDQDLVFAKPTGEPMPADHVSERLEVRLRRVGLPHIRFHDLRHTYAQTMAYAGVPLRTISDLLGHASLNITQRYLEVTLGLQLQDLDRKIQATERLQEIYGR